MSRKKPSEVVSIDERDLSHEDFVAIWTRSDSAAEAARRMSRVAEKPLAKSYVVDRARRYRAQGVRLKYMKRAVAA